MADRKPSAPISSLRHLAAVTRYTGVTRARTLVVITLLLLTMCFPHCSSQGVTTVEPTDPCVDDPCENDAACAPGGSGEYYCSCNAGWTGQNCGEDIDECFSSPCANGAPCENGLNYFRCNCPAGYTGSFCSEDVDECLPEPCSPGGQCTDQVGSFTCDCLPGYTGDACETDIDDCAGTPCLNNGTCEDGMNNFTCKCNRYWTGNTCQEDVDECALNPAPDCHPLSTCTNTAGGYTCTCPVGYSGTGKTCQFIDMCENNPCAHGTCVKLTLNFTCVCDEGWTGDNCTEDIDECKAASGECDATYGDCLNTPGSFQCQCRAGSHGNGVVCIRDTVYPLGTSSKSHNADADRSAVYTIPGGLPYFGSRYFKVYASIDGYVSFRQDYLPPNPPGGATPMFPPGSAIIAPWWTDLDTTNEPGALWVDAYEPSDGSDIFSNISTDVRGYVNDVNLTYVLVFTWREVEPYPSYKATAGKENATFQLVLATTNEESFAMLNYNPDGPWLNMDAKERRYLIGFSFGNGSDMIIQLLGDTPGDQSNIGHKGRYFLPLGGRLPTADMACLTWYRGQRSRGQRSAAPACPCTRTQAGLDTRYEASSSAGCVQGVFTDGSGGRQMCCYDSMGALQTGYPNGGYPIIPGDADARSTCCETSKLCHLFYKLRPSDDCRSYSPPRWGLAWGIGHYETVNSELLMFNNRGEFTLFQQSSFTCQGRMDLVPSLATDMMTTALVAVACKAGNSSVAEVAVAPTGLAVTVDGKAAEFGLYPGLSLSEPESGSVNLQFNSGDGVLVTGVDDVLRVRLMVQEVLPGAIGLFTATPGGTQQQLSQYAAIPSGDSLFMNKNFSFADYVPTDLSAAIDELKKRSMVNDSEAAASCDQEDECLRDFIATGDDIFRGVSAITEMVTMRERRRMLENKPPFFNPNLKAVIRVNRSQAIILKVAAADAETTNITYKLFTNLDPEDYVFVDNYFRWEATPKNGSVYIRFTATDSKGATSIYWPEVRFCDCVLGNIRSCDFEYMDILGSKSNQDRYVPAECPCLPGYGGRTCGDTVDLCSPNPCYTSSPNNTCTVTAGVLPYGVTCTACPGDLSGDGLRCFDTNECLRGTSKCSHRCVNQPGSYSCDCPDGFELREDKATCQDRDECTLKEHDCSGEGKYCNNVPGSYTCTCKLGYFMQNDTCIYAPRLYAGTLTFAAILSPSGTMRTWTSDLENKDSKRYIQDKEAVERQVNEMYQKVPGYKATQVTGMSQGSIKAHYNIYLASGSPADASTLDKTLEEYLELKGCTPGGPDCTVGQFVGVSASQSFVQVKDLCQSSEDNDCDTMSTNCSSHSDGTFSCSCLPGFQAWLDVTNICQDVNECEDFHGCDPDTAECVNTPGSYGCECRSSYRKLDDACVPACVPNPCYNDGECFPDASAAARYTCRCKDFWSGPTCKLVNKHARRLELILIGVGVGLGALCLILLIVIIVTCIRCRAKESHDSDTEVNDKKMNDRVRNVKRTYSTTSEVGLDSWENNSHVGAPPAHHLRTTQFEMTENGSKQNLLSGGKYSPRRIDPPGNYDNGGTGATPGGGMGVENPSYASSPGEGGAHKLDSQYF